MSLSTGDRLGPYVIVAPIGAGGMGEVYRARDTKLDREVAIKVLPAALAQHPDRLARFEREAKVLAALNHPNIAMIHGLEDRAIVMELVEDPTLADRIRSGAIPLDESLKIAAQIADALEAAHERGIVHRDLKPANVKVREDGTAKVLDFGLATAVQSGASQPGEGANSPTLTMGATEAGVILGTAAYMSPEQAAGKPVDRRADIWSFGVVLWEMLTGKRLFEGETVSHTLAHVLAAPIDFNQLPAKTPPVIRNLVRRCLDRSAKNRLRDIGEARVAIDAAFGPAEPTASSPKARSQLAIGAASIPTLLLAALAFIHFREVPPEHPHVRFQLNPPAGYLNGVKLSPDGRFLALTIAAGSGSAKIWIRSLDGLDTRPLAELQGGGGVSMFWSRDGETAFVYNDHKLYKVARSGGPAVPFADVPQRVLGGVQLDDGNIVLGVISGLFRIPSSGGAPLKIDDQQAVIPAWLPGSRFLFVGANGIFAGSLDGRKPVQIVANASSPAYVPPFKAGLPGYLLFLRGGTLLAQSFRAERLELQGEAIPVASRVADLRDGGFSAAVNGVLVFAGAESDNAALTWLDRAGKRLQSVGKPFRMAQNPAIRLSPNDTQAIVPIAGANGPDLWIADLNRNTFSRFTFNGSSSGIWSPDGRKVLWAARDGNRYLKLADGSGKDELLFKNPANSNTGYVMDWSSDGSFVTVSARTGTVSPTIWIVPMKGDRKPYPYLDYEFSNYWAQISPDNRWMLFMSDQSPGQQIFIESIPAGRGRWQVSAEGGDWPTWRRDGKELFYRAGTKLMAMSVRLTDASVELGRPQELFDVPEATRFQVSRDGQRFLIALPVSGATTSTPLTVDTDWRVGLSK